MITYAQKIMNMMIKILAFKKRATARPIKLKFHFSNTLRYWQSHNGVQREIPFETQYNIILAVHKAKQNYVFIFKTS